MKLDLVYALGKDTTALDAAVSNELATCLSSFKIIVTKDATTSTRTASTCLS